MLPAKVQPVALLQHRDRVPSSSVTSPGASTSQNTTSPSSTTSIPSPSTTTSTTSSSSHSGPDTLVVEEGTQPDSMDPAVEFTTPGNEITSNVYQGLVAPYLSSNSQYVGVLAESWTSTSDQMNWNFTLRQGVTFSNGDPFNAYVMWYPLYRTLIVNQAPSFILGQNFGVNSSGANISDTALNSMNYSSPSVANLSLMEAPLQSFQVINQSEIALHLGYGYNGNVSVLCASRYPDRALLLCSGSQGRSCQRGRNRQYKELLDADQRHRYRVLSPELLGAGTERKTRKEHELLGRECALGAIELRDSAFNFGYNHHLLQAYEFQDRRSKVWGGADIRCD